MQIRSKERLIFKKAVYNESCEALHNPGCGWYHIYTFEAQPPSDGRPVEEEVWLDEFCKEEQLALVLIDIGAFKERALSREALLHIDRILAFFHEIHKQMILRFVYDRFGEGIRKEPSEISVVKQHMKQLGERILIYRADILVIQGIFVGNWGEMHGSKFLDDTSMCELAGTLYQATKGQFFLAVRTPAQRRRIMGVRPYDPEFEKRLALYNDAMFGSATDLGTYGFSNRTEAGEMEKWNRSEELDWQDTHVSGMPNGGEVLSGKSFKGYQEATEEMKKMHICYLNSIYHPKQLEFWKKEIVRKQGCFKGLCGYDYIGLHLGYRFVVRDVKKGSGEDLLISVENCGFGNLCEEAECIFLMEDNKGREILRECQDIELRNWERGKKTNFFIKNPEKCGKVFLMLKRKHDGRIIRFANQDAGKKILLGELVRRKS